MCILKIDKVEEQKDKNYSQLIIDTLTNKEEER